MVRKPELLKWDFPKYRGRYVYRTVELRLDDFKKLEIINKRLNKFYFNADIMHMRDYDELKAIITTLNKIIKRYQSEFKEHSFEDIVKKRKNGGDSGKLIREMRDDRARRISGLKSQKDWFGMAKGIGPFTKKDELDEQ